MVAGKLVRAAEAEASRRGATRFTWHCRAGTPLASMLARRGYTPHRMLNTILRDFFTLIDKNERARAKAESAQAGTNLKAPNADEPGRA